jgi:hypothetical protein
VFIEFQPLNDVIAEPDTEISVRLSVAWNRDRAAAHVEAGHPRNFRGRSVSLGVRALIQDQLNPCRPERVKFISIGLSFCWADAHKPPFMRSNTIDVANPIPRQCQYDLRKAPCDRTSDSTAPWSFVCLCVQLQRAQRVTRCAASAFSCSAPSSLVNTTYSGRELAAQGQLTGRADCPTCSKRFEVVTEPPPRGAACGERIEAAGGSRRLHDP